MIHWYQICKIDVVNVTQDAYSCILAGFCQSMALCIQLPTLISNLYFFSLMLCMMMFCISCTSSNDLIVILISTHVLVCCSISCMLSSGLIVILITTHVLVCCSISCILSSGLIVILILTHVLVCCSIRRASSSGLIGILF